MNQRFQSQTVLGVAGLALTMVTAQAALAKPPAHAPAYGYRAKHPTAHRPHHWPRTSADIDGDGIPNGRDRDMDGDGIPNDRDPNPKVANRHHKPLPKGAVNSKTHWLKKPAVHDPKRAARQGDIDKDGIKNRKDKDLDNDGIRNKKDHDKDGDGIANKKDKFDRRQHRK